MTTMENTTENFMNFSTHNGSLFMINTTATCQLPFAMALTMFVINVFVSFLGTSGNLLVCLAVLITPNLQRISNYFICCLAIADLTINAADQPLLAVMLWGKMHGSCSPHIEFAFRVIGNVSCSASLLTLCFISIDRCVCITKPFSYLSIITKTKFFFMVLAAWLFAGTYTYLRLEVSKKITSYVTVGMFATGYAVFVTCYLLIIIKIKQQSKERLNLAGYKKKSSQASQSVEKRLAVTVALLMLVFTIAWAPLFYLRVTSPKKNYGILYDWARTIALSSSAVNPALYCMRNEDYRNAFGKILRFLFCCRAVKRYQLRSSTTTTPRTVSSRVAS